MKLHVEAWTSTNNRHERHYFLQDGRQHGYQVDGAYLVGINQELVSPDLETQILELLKPIWDV